MCRRGCFFQVLKLLFSRLLIRNTFFNFIFNILFFLLILIFCFLKCLSCSYLLLTCLIHCLICFFQSFGSLLNGFTCITSRFVLNSALNVVWLEGVWFIENWLFSNFVLDFLQAQKLFFFLNLGSVHVDSLVLGVWIVFEIQNLFLKLINFFLLIRLCFICHLFQFFRFFFLFFSYFSNFSFFALLFFNKLLLDSFHLLLLRFFYLN